MFEKNYYINLNLITLLQYSLASINSQICERRLRAPHDILDKWESSQICTWGRLSKSPEAPDGREVVSKKSKFVIMYGHCNV